MVASFTIFCVDPRIPAIAQAVIDQITVGDTKAFFTSAIGASQGIDGEVKKIRDAIEKLGVEKVNIVDHLDCLAFRLVLGPLALDQEHEYHIASLQNAHQHLGLRLPPGIFETKLYVLTDVYSTHIEPKVVEVNPPRN